MSCAHWSLRIVMLFQKLVGLLSVLNLVGSVYIVAMKLVFHIGLVYLVVAHLTAYHPFFATALVIRNSSSLFSQFETYCFSDLNVTGAIAGSGRLSRGVHFHASKDDLTVELELIIPFFKIPIKRNMALARNAVRSLLNLQMPALFSMAVIVLTGTIPIALSKMAAMLSPLFYYDRTIMVNPGSFNTYTHTPHYEKSENELGGDKINKSLRIIDIQMTECIQYYLCVWFRTPTNSQTNSRKTILDIISVDLLRPYIEGTLVHNAIMSSAAAQSCEERFITCRWIQFINVLLSGAQA